MYTPLASRHRLLIYIYTHIRTAHSKIYKHIFLHTHTHTHIHIDMYKSRRECMSRVFVCISCVPMYVYRSNLRRRHAHRARNSLNQFGRGSCRPHNCDCCAWDIEFVLPLSCRVHAYIFTHAGRAPAEAVWCVAVIRGRLGEGVGGSGKNPRRCGRRGRNPGRTRVRSFRLKSTPRQVDTRVSHNNIFTILNLIRERAHASAWAKL